MKIDKADDNMNLVQETNKLLWECENYHLEYKPTLKIESKIQFGIELEYEQANQKAVTEIIGKLYKEKILSYHKNNSIWISKDDSSVHVMTNNETYGGEIASAILTDDKESWNELKIVCDMLKSLGAISTEKTSTHVHVDQSILGTDAKNWLNFIKLWITYEEIIYRFLFGEYSCGRGRLEQYCAPVRKQYLKDIRLYNLDELNNLDVLITRLKLGKYYGINFMNATNNIRPDKINTIEIRVANGTLEPKIIQNNILFIDRLFEASKNISEEYINNKIKKLSIYSEENFNELYIYEAIELANLLYKDEYEKLSFLKQYLKSYEISNEFKRVNSITA